MGDDGFRFYRSLYSYDRTDLKPVIESVDESSPYWRKERITFAAAYGNERLIGYLFLPKNAARPTRQSFISQVATPCARPPARICRCGGWSS